MTTHGFSYISTASAETETSTMQHHVRVGSNGTARHQAPAAGRMGHAENGLAADILAPLAAADADRPLVVAQLGQSLDGRIATVSGESRYINGGAALDHLHHLRAHVDAVVVGIGTVVADDPLLTVRRVPGRNPARVVIDPNGRLPEAARCIADDGAERVVIRAAGAAVPRGVDEVVIPARGPWIAPAAIIEALQRRGYRRILIEGGARTISLFLDSGCVDRLHVLVAPMIIGSGKPGLELAPIVELGRALRPATTVEVLADGNVLFACDLRRSQTETSNGNGLAARP